MCPSSTASDRQLRLPLPGSDPEAAPRQRIPSAERIWVNRNLELGSIRWVGFDMDYTLAIYRQQAMDSLSVQLTVERMVARGYPPHLAQLRFDHRFPIRGLLVDKKHGNVLKMNRYKVVGKGYHGTTALDSAQIEQLYHHKHLRPHTPRYHWIDTLFSLSEVTAYASIVDSLERHGQRVDHRQLFQDVRACIDEAHADSSFYKVVLADKERYLERDQHLAATLHKLRSAGKRLFLLTNSPWAYTEPVMSYLLEGALEEYPSWRHYFDVVIVAAQKPRWFQEGRPLLEREGNMLKDLEPPLERGKVYEGGSLRQLERLLGVPSSHVLYVGDHIYGDMLRSKKESAWRTAMIIPELDTELTAHADCGQEMRRQRELEGRHAQLEEELRFYQARFKALAKAKEEGSEEERVRVKRAISRIRGELKSVDHEHDALRRGIDHHFHPYWGSLLKDANELSIFGLQVETYADLYTSRVSSLRHYSPLQSFRSPHDLMPHEL